MPCHGPMSDVLPLDADTVCDDDELPPDCDTDGDDVAVNVAKKPAAKQHAKKAVAKKPASLPSVKQRAKKVTVNKPARRFRRKSPCSMGIKEFLHATPGCLTCPEEITLQPTLPSGLVAKAGFWEIFSPPRVVPFVRGLGGMGLRSVDLETGWDLLDDGHIKNLLDDMHQARPRFVFLSPPCTYFSQLMFSNWWRMDKDIREQCLRNAVTETLKHVVCLFRASPGRPLPKPITLIV